MHCFACLRAIFMSILAMQEGELTITSLWSSSHQLGGGKKNRREDN